VTDLVIETRGLRKEFRGHRGRTVVAVGGLDLTVPRGGVHGFLGPNGSGKTTTLRMLLGLASPSDGEMRLFGEPVPRRLAGLMSRVGAVVEQPKFLPSFTGHRNLALLARTAGVPTSRVDEALDRVGLAGRGADRYRSYSLGMKQRLAIAATLLKQPELLILDEPSNGLDPAGIRDVRHLVRELAGEGTTVLLSSHILAEVQQVCDSVSIIHDGRLLSEGRVDELVGRERGGRLRLEVADPEAAVRVLRQAGLGAAPGGGGVVHVEGARDPADVTRLLAEQELYVRELVPERADLEQVFLRLTSAERPGGQA
jgi:ABC-2 type transport system ATP-binding protein